MLRIFQIIGIILLALGLAACSSLPPAAQEVASTFQATPTVETHPLSTRTGMQEIDQVLDVVASGDAEGLRALVQFTSAECTLQEGLGGPPKCRAGEAEGTPVDVLPFLGPEGSFLRKDEIGNWPGIEVSGLYAIYEVAAKIDSDENYPAGEYAVLLVGQGNEPAISLRLRDGKILRVDFLLDHSPEELNGWLQREASKLIVAPLSQ